MSTWLRNPLKFFFWIFAAYHAVVITSIVSLVWQPLYQELTGQNSHFDWQTLALKTANSLVGLSLVWLMHAYLYRSRYVGAREDIALRTWLPLLYVSTLLNLHRFTFGATLPHLGPVAMLEFSMFAVVVVIFVNARKLMGWLR